MVLDDSWMKDAACKGADTELFFPDTRTGVVENISKAKRYCFTCPVRLDCLSYAFAHNIRYGVWGGYSRSQRYKVFTKEERAKIIQAWLANHPQHHLHTGVTLYVRD